MLLGIQLRNCVNPSDVEECCVVGWFLCVLKSLFYLNYNLRGSFESK